MCWWIWWKASTAANHGTGNQFKAVTSPKPVELSSNKKQTQSQCSCQAQPRGLTHFATGFASGPHLQLFYTMAIILISSYAEMMPPFPAFCRIVWVTTVVPITPAAQVGGAVGAPGGAKECTLHTWSFPVAYRWHGRRPTASCNAAASTANLPQNLEGPEPVPVWVNVEVWAPRNASTPEYCHIKGHKLLALQKSQPSFQRWACPPQNVAG